MYMKARRLSNLQFPPFPPPDPRPAPPRPAPPPSYCAPLPLCSRRCSRAALLPRASTMVSVATGRSRTLALLWAQRSDSAAATLCDLRVGVEYAHSFVLAAASPVAASALTARKPPPHLCDAAPQVQHALLELAYGVPCAPSRDLPATHLLQLARICAAMQMGASTLECVDRALAPVVNADDAVEAMRVASSFNLPRTAAACRALLKTRLSAVSNAPAWRELPPDRVAAALRVHDLMPRAEEVVFRALEAWLAHDFENRKPHARSLLRLVRFPTMSDRALLRVARSPYFAGSDEFYQLLLEAFIRRAEVRLVYVPRVTGSTDAESPTKESKAGAAETPVWRRANVTDTSLGELGETMNLRDQRSIMFEGLFPLKWYKNMRFRTRSSAAMLFTFVVTNWSTRRRRVCSESRSFGDHRWSLWIDPYAAAAAAAAGETKQKCTTPSQNDYISLFLCCEAEHRATGTESWPEGGDEEGEGVTTATAPVDEEAAQGGSETQSAAAMNMSVDYALFLVSANDNFGMERKVCMGRSFTFSGQAMGFRRHTRRTRLSDAGFYDAQRDQLIVGAHVVIPGAHDAGVERPDVEAGALPVSDASKRSSTSRVSMDSWPRTHRESAPTDDDLLRDLPPAALLHPAFAAYARRAHDPLVRGASAVSATAASEAAHTVPAAPP